MVKVAVTQHFAHSFDARFFAAAHLGIDLGDIEDIHPHVMAHGQGLLIDGSAGLVVIIAGDDQRRALG